jgi:hypothetical protein
VIRSTRFAFTALAAAALCASALAVAPAQVHPQGDAANGKQIYLRDACFSPATAAPGKAASSGGRHRSLPGRRCRSTALENCCATRQATCRPIRKRCCRTRTSSISTPSSSRCRAHGRRKVFRVSIIETVAPAAALRRDGPRTRRRPIMRRWLRRRRERVDRIEAEVEALYPSAGLRAPRCCDPSSSVAKSAQPTNPCA